MSLESQISMAFPTLVGRFTAPISEAMRVNTELRELILNQERVIPNDAHANAGGWHSNSDFFEWTSPAVRVLQGWVGEAVQRMIHSTLEYMNTMGMPRAFQGSIRLTAWANVARKFHFHRLHNHPGCSWSGVYYVNDGDREENRSPLSGVLELVDPRPFTEMVFTPGEPYGQRITIRPRSGMMVIFPSFLYHLVNPYMGDGERISVAFNAQAIENTDRKRGIPQSA